MDDRFDRRELLLHLGDILEAASRLARGTALDTPLARRIGEDESLREFSFLPTLAAQMTVSEFSAGAASAFSQWPRELLETELNRDALASTVQLNLFDGDPDGWNAYIAHIQKTVPWFGVGLPEVKRRTKDQATPAEQKDAAESSAHSSLPGEKKGWPWPESRPAR